MAEKSSLKAGQVNNISNHASPSQPGAAAFRNVLYQAHRDTSGKDNARIYVYGMGENKDPNVWDAHNPSDGWKTSHSPALAAFTDCMYLAWKGGNDNTNIWYGKMDKDKKWNDQKKIEAMFGGKNYATTKVAPSIVNYPESIKKEQLFMFYVRDANKNGVGTIYWTRLNDDGTWAVPLTGPNEVVMNSKFAPSLAWLGKDLYIAWLNENNNVVVARMYRAKNGTAGTMEFIDIASVMSPADPISSVAPTIFTNNGVLNLVWSSDTRKYTMSSRLVDKKWTTPAAIFYSATGKPVSNKNTVPHFIEKFRMGLFGIWADQSDNKKLKYSNFSGMKVSNVFLLMLENRSFDHMLGFSQIPGIKGLTGNELNEYNYQAYKVSNDAPLTIKSDPGHEFEDAYEQLCGQGTTFRKGDSYPGNGNTVKMTGFVANFSKASDKSGKAPLADVMKCYTPERLPILNQLAREYAVCDQWYSSIPGPTVPNRFFSLAATSGGLDSSPSGFTLGGWMGINDALEAYGALGTPVLSPLLITLYAAKKTVQLIKNGDIYNGLRFANGSIFGRIKYPKSRIFIDQKGDHKMGRIPMSLCMGEVRYNHYHYLEEFYSVIKQKNYAPAFTLIEPNYGNASGDFSGGSSQHPVDDVSKGEQLIKNVYEAIRNSPNWENSVLIITYDEHGGFYDHMKPPKAVPPGDADHVTNVNGFKFDSLGVRVPAIVISPWVKKGKVDSTIYDHSSISATLTALFGMQPLTNRDRAAQNVTPLLELESSRPDSDCPAKLKNVVTDIAAKSKTQSASLTANKKATKVLEDSEPLPRSGNVMIFLFNALKIHAELGKQSNETLMVRFAGIQTRGQAAKFMNEAVSMVEARMKNKKPGGKDAKQG